MSVSEEYLFKNDSSKLRTHVSCKVGILLLFTYNSGLQGEDSETASRLRCYLIDMLLSTTLNSAAPELVHNDLNLTTSLENQSSTNVPSPTPQLESATPGTSSFSDPPSSGPLIQPTTPASSSFSDPPSSGPLIQPTTPASSSFSDAIPSKRTSTESLLQRQQSIRNKQDKGRKYKSRTVVRRLNMQKEKLAQLTKTVHSGKKQDFLVTLAESVVSQSQTKSSEDVTEDWDGTLSPQDILILAKHAHDPKKRMTVYDTIITESAPQYYHLSASDVLDIQDTTSPTEIVRTLRRKLPGFIDSERKVNTMKAKFVKEFEVVWKPERTNSGWKINPQRLRETLLHLYWWLPESEWWKIYGDGRNFGGKDSVALTLNVLNDEAMFQGIGYHSPEEYWPIYIFYGKDTRLNLELNLGDPNKHGGLNKWIETMLDSGHQIYLSSDAKFSDNLLGGGLDPTSEDAFTMYNYETKQTRSEVGSNTGLRSELGRKVEREHPESLLPSLPTANFIPDGNHCFCRLTEHMVFDRCMSCLNLENQPSMGPGAKDQTLGHFMSNINARGVRNGKFELHFDGKKLEQVTLNVNHAETISAPTSYFGENPFPDILDNVASRDVLFDLPQKLRDHLQWPTPQISEFELERKIWNLHWELHELERFDEDPRKYAERLKPGSSASSSDPKDYRFGLTAQEIKRYEELADLHHALTLLRYGSSKLYPYLMKRVDVFPQMFRDLPFHSLFRGGTEGGERTHYLHQCLYFGHSARGGGWKCQDPIITLFRWYYRFLRRRLAKCPPEVQDAYDHYVRAKFEEEGLDYSTEMRAVEETRQTVPPVSEQPLSTVQPADQINQPEEPSAVQTCPSEPANQSSEPMLIEGATQSTVPDPSVELSPNYKRGDVVFIEKDGKATKAMVCEVTPQKKRVRVAVNAKERPALVEISNLLEPVPQVLHGVTFVISGRLNGKDRSGITNAEQLTPVILRNGGKVYSRDISKVTDATFIMVTSQKEIDKDIKKINKPIIHAYRYKWPIVSKLYVLEADKDKAIPDIDQYKLNISNLDNAPASSLAHARAVKESELLNSSTRSAHRELKKVLRQKRKAAQDEENQENDIPKREPKRPANGYIIFLKEEFSQLAKGNPNKTMKEINAMLAEKWKSMSEEEQAGYKEMGKTQFQDRTEKWHKALEQTRAAETYYARYRNLLDCSH